jgi:hypothetical protein
LPFPSTSLDTVDRCLLRAHFLHLVSAIQSWFSSYLLAAIALLHLIVSSFLKHVK